MNQIYYHDPCPMTPDDADKCPEYKWGGFSMAGAADYICETCGDRILVVDEPEVTAEVTREQVLEAVKKVLGEQYDNLMASSIGFLMVINSAALRCFIDQKPGQKRNELIIRQGIIQLEQVGYLA